MLADCPYRSLPDIAYWKRAVATPAREAVDPVTRTPFKIGPKDKVATAGSCFAQHVARALSNVGLNYYVPERPPALFDEGVGRDFGYGVYSARYGNIYTVRQLIQLVERAYGRFEPVEDCWLDDKGGVLDPFRPNIQPVPFASEKEMRLDRASHLAAVRKMFEELDVFVFTLGLTETWLHADDGAAFPVCPGCGGGEFDPNKHKFVNMSVEQVVQDLHVFVAQLRSVNPKAKILLTVSPVPLIATMSGGHVLTATTYSKSVLRVAAETISNAYDHVAYFPSYEVITGAHAGGAHYASDLREIRESGVQHAMRLFLKHFADSDAPAAVSAEAAAPKATAPKLADGASSDDVIDVVCDEKLLVAAADAAR